MIDNRTDIRDKNGRWLVAPPGSEETRITTANARSMAQRRWEKYRRAAVREIVEEAKSINPAVATSADAYGLLMANQYTKLLDSQKPAVDQVEKLGKMLTGMDTEARRENAQDAPDSISGSPEALMQLVTMIEADRRQAVDRARAVDATATDTRNE